MVKNKVIRRITLILAVIFSLILIIFLIRLINPVELDDLTLGIPCEQSLINKADVLWVITKFNGISIAENRSWCQQIRGLNKTVGMHGVMHEYNEFRTDRAAAYLDEGMNDFEQCFGFRPTMFKPPQLNVSKNNIELIENNGMEIKSVFNQITHKVYHCNDSDIIKNRIIDWF